MWNQDSMWEISVTGSENYLMMPTSHPGVHSLWFCLCRPPSDGWRSGDRFHPRPGLHCCHLCLPILASRPCCCCIWVFWTDSESFHLQRHPSISRDDTDVTHFTNNIQDWQITFTILSLCSCVISETIESEVWRKKQTRIFLVSCIFIQTEDLCHKLWRVCTIYEGWNQICKNNQNSWRTINKILCVQNVIFESLYLVLYPTSED